MPEGVRALLGLRDAHGTLTDTEFAGLVARYRRAAPGDAAVLAERLLGSYAPLLYAIAKRHRLRVALEDAVAAAIGGFFDAINDPSVPAKPLRLRKAINSQVTGAVRGERALLRSATVNERAIEKAGTAAREAPAIDGMTEAEAAVVVSTGMRGVRFQMLRALSAPGAVPAHAVGTMTAGATRSLDALPGTLDAASAGLTMDDEGETGSAPPYFGIDDEALAETLATLAPADARTLILRFGLFGRPAHEVGELAALEGASEAAMRKRVTRAMQRLRVAFADRLEAQHPAGVAALAEMTAREHAADVDDAAFVACDVRHRYGISPAANRYREELDAAVARQADRLAIAFREIAQDRAWDEGALFAAVRRFAQERSGIHADLLVDAILSRLAGPDAELVIAAEPVPAPLDAERVLQPLLVGFAEVPPRAVREVRATDCAAARARVEAAIGPRHGSTPALEDPGSLLLPI